MSVLFYVCVIIIIYVYFGYFLLLFICSAIRPKDVNKKEIFPSVSLVLCVYNEQARIKRKIRNCLDLNYPKDKLQVIIVSDASTDKTDEIIANFKDSQIHFLRLPLRRGKTLAQNAALSLVSGEIIVFSDASANLDRNALKILISNFYDPRVGLVSGEDYWYDERTNVTSKGHGLYVEYEMMLRCLESKVGSTVSASGCFYGVRTELHSELAEAVIDDLAVPLNVVRKGYRVVTDSDAIVRIPRVSNPEKDFSRRTRIIVGGLTSFFKNLDLLNPLKYKFFSLQLLSHKLLRWLIPFFLPITLVSNIFLLGSDTSYLYEILLILQLFFYVFASIGYVIRHRPGISKLFSIPFFLCSSNISIAVAWMKFLRGNRFETWEPSRS